MENVLWKTSSLSMTLGELLKQAHVLLTFIVSFKTMKLLNTFGQVLAPEEVEFLRDSRCLTHL